MKLRGWACSADGKHSMAKARDAQPLCFGKRPHPATANQHTDNSLPAAAAATLVQQLSAPKCPDRGL